MRYGKVVGIALLVGTVACLVWLVWAGTANAKGYESVGIKEAHAKVLRAQREVAAAKARLSEARAVESATRTYVGQYGVTVGRWVWLANDVGWPRSTWGQLCYVIERESGGSPKAYNVSGASGLLQLMPGWYAGDYYNFPDFDPFVPRLNLYYGYKGYKESGWQPWAL
jgi:hypothetical protein